MNYVYQLKIADGGFYNHMFIMISHYLQANKMGAKFYIDDHRWLYTNSIGWSDYFCSTEFLLDKDYVANGDTIYIKDPYNTPHNSLVGLSKIIVRKEADNDMFKICDYARAFSNVYILQPHIIQKMDELLVNINFTKGDFDAIMVRRGDKMIDESKLIPIEQYIQPLIDRGTQKIYINTDDYNAYKEIENIINTTYKDRGITVFTLCPKDKIGAIGFTQNLLNTNINTTRNKEYCRNMLENTRKAVDQYNSEEMKRHIENMLIDNEICKLARYLSLDFQSNLTRFLCITHTDPSRVINIENNLIPDFDKYYDYMGEVFLGRKYNE